MDDLEHGQGGCDEQKRDQAVEEEAVSDVTTVDISREGTKIRLAV